MRYLSLMRKVSLVIDECSQSSCMRMSVCVYACTPMYVHSRCACVCVSVYIDTGLPVTALLAGSCVMPLR